MPGFIQSLAQAEKDHSYVTQAVMMGMSWYPDTVSFVSCNCMIRHPEI